MNQNRELFNEIPNEDYIVLSLQPEPFDLIKKGIKTFEFRTRFVKKEINAFIYVTTPVGAIQALIRFGTPICGNAEEISLIAERDRPGTKEGVYRYIQHSNAGFAIPVKSLEEFQPFHLKELRADFQFVAPQSYFRLHSGTPLFQALMNRLKEATK